MIIVELKTAEKTLTFNPASIEIPAPGLNENLQHQEQSVSITAVYDPELLNLTATERDITVTVRDDYTTIFKGRLSNNQSWQDNGRPTPIEKFSLSVSDNTYLLDRKTENIIALKNTTLAAVITRLCQDCNVTIAYPETLPQISMEFFVMEAGKKYKDVLDSVLIQHCYAYAFDGAGNLIIFDLNSELAKEATPITESDMLSGVSVSQTTKDFSGAKVTYNPLLKKTNEQVYFEGNSLGSEKTVTPITLRGGQYYPYDSDPVQEEREGQVFQTFASGYAESYTTYSGETKYQRSEKTSLLYTENHSLVKDWDTGIEVDRTQFEATRASVRFRNTTDGDRNLMQLAIRADAWYRNGDASVTSGDATGSLYETDAEFIFTAEKAEKLAKLCSRFFCGRTFKISARLNHPVIPGGNYSIDTGSSGTQFTALAISCTYDPDKAICSATFLSYGDILVDTTRFKETASGNPLDSVISEISNKLEGVISGQPEMGPPSPPKTLKAVAEEKGIQLSCVPEIVGVRNSITAFKWEINKGNGWEQRESAEPSYFWQFDRSTDGYPEATDFAAWRVRCYVVSIYGKNSEYTPEQNINTDQYGTWKLLPPKVTVSVSNRAINLKMEQPQRSDNRPVYGTLTHRIEVKNPKIDTEFFKPAESLDPYASELNYKECSGYVTAVLSYTQIMPLEGQNDDPPGPTYTLYQFRIIAANEATTSEPTIQNATANPTSVYDMVKGWYKNEQGEKVKIPGALGAESIYTESLAAISANMGDITAGKISSVPEAGETKPNVTLDLDKEEFRIGNNPSLEDSGSDDAEYIHYRKGHGLVMKIKNFIVTAVASIVSGVFRVKGKGTADADSFFVVNPESTTDAATGTPARSTKLSGQIVGHSNIPIAPQYYELDLRDLPKDKWFPVFFDITQMELSLELHSENFIASNPYNQNVITIRWIVQGWSDLPKKLTVSNYGLYENTEITIMMLVEGLHDGGRAIYLRGGLMYRMLSNLVPNLKTSDFIYSDEVYPVVSDYTAGANTRIVWRADEMIASNAWNQLQNLKVDGSLTVTGNATVEGNMSIKGDISITGNHPTGTLPVGTVYVQYPNQSEPASIFGGTWSNISSQYAGRFFRSEGGNAVAFGNGQAEGLPYMVHEHTYFAVGRFGMNGTNISTPAWGSGDKARGSAYAYINTTNYKDVSGSGLYGKSTHVTPENMTIRIWKRIN